MCYNFETSIYSWFIALFMSLLLVLRNNSMENVWIMAFILTYTQVQILEAIIWTDINKTDDGSKKRVADITKLILLAILAQPLINSLFGYFATGNSLLFYMTILYIIIWLYMFNTIKSYEFNSRIGPNGHLIWEKTKNGKTSSLFGDEFYYIGIIYLIGLFLPQLFMENKLKGYLFTGFGIISAIYSQIKYPQEMGSMWCFIAVFGSIIANMI